MGLPDITADAVLAAVAEFNQLGRERFLETYGFGPARDYFLVIDGKQYDSKAIVGVAHGFIGLGSSVLTASDFGGGEATVARLLSRLGFAVLRPTDSRQTQPSKRNPSWSDEELILALDLYLREGLLDADNAQVVELSEILNTLSIHVDRPDAERFRNPNGVALKMANFAALDPGHAGKGMSRGGKRDGEIWNRFSRDEDILQEAAARIRLGADWRPLTTDAPAVVLVSSVEIEALNAERFLVERRATAAEAERREQRLVHDYKLHLLGGGHRIVRHKYDLDGRALYCDLFDETSWSLHEAKGDVRRESVRMAVGQLLDYSRFYDRRPRLVLLLPRRPSEDIGEFLSAVGIESVYRDLSGRWSPAVLAAPISSPTTEST